MFYLRFIGTVHFHKSWNAPTAKYSCPQLHAYMHHNYYARYPLRALSQLYSPPRITCSQQHIFDTCIIFDTFVYISLSNLLVREGSPIPRLSSNLTIRFDHWHCVWHFVSATSFFSFFGPRFTWKNHMVPIQYVSCQERVYRILFFSRMCSLLNINPGLLQATTI